MSIRLVWVLYATSIWLVSCTLDWTTNCCVKIEKAEDLLNMDDRGTVSDPYVVMYGKDTELTGYASTFREYETQTIWNNLSPEWNEEHCVDSVSYDSFYFAVYNENLHVEDDYLGHTDYKKIDITDLDCDDEKEFELEVSEGGKLTVSINCDYNCPIEKREPDAAVRVTSMEDEEEMMIETKATFTEEQTGVSGFVELDEDGNVFLDLDVTNLDTSACSFVNGELSLKYGIFNMWTHGLDDVTAKKGATECGTEFVGEMFDPFDRALCSELAMDDVSYYSCKLGDLSGRFGVVAPDENNKIEIEGNVSEDTDNHSKDSGDCKARLMPESLHQRSMVFMCNDENETPLFCAPFMIEFEEISV